MLTLSPPPTDPSLHGVSQLGVHNPVTTPFHCTLVADVRGTEH